MERKPFSLPSLMEQIDQSVTAHLKLRIAEKNICPKSIQMGVEAYFNRPSKKLRPLIFYLSAYHFGAQSMEKALLNVACAIECFHTWTLVHDDIIDEDHMRRGASSCHVFLADYYEKQGIKAKEAQKLGKDLAILVGDVHQGLCVEWMLTKMDGVDLAVSLGLLLEMEGTLKPKLLEGEALDVVLSYRSLKKVTKEELYQMMREKTGRLFQFSAYAGMAMATGSLDVSQEGRCLLEGLDKMSLAFQMQDDILGLVGDEKVFGKPIGSDLREGKRTLILLDAFQSLSLSEQDVFSGLLEKKAPSEESISMLMGLIEKSGALYRAEIFCKEMFKEAREKVMFLRPTPYRDGICVLIEQMSHRKK